MSVCLEAQTRKETRNHIELSISDLGGVLSQRVTACFAGAAIVKGKHREQ
jgi:hypothetical protein